MFCRKRISWHHLDDICCRFTTSVASPLLLSLTQPTQSPISWPEHVIPWAMVGESLSYIMILRWKILKKKKGENENQQTKSSLSCSLFLSLLTHTLPPSHQSHQSHQSHPSHPLLILILILIFIPFPFPFSLFSALFPKSSRKSLVHIMKRVNMPAFLHISAQWPFLILSRQL